MKITKEWHELRLRLFRVNGTVTESIIADLNAAPHPDGPYLAKIVPLGADRKALFAFLIDHPEPLARLYGLWAVWRYIRVTEHFVHPDLDHSLARLLSARRRYDYEEVANIYNEPDAWIELGDFDSCRKAASLGDPIASNLCLGSRTTITAAENFGYARFLMVYDSGLYNYCVSCFLWRYCYASKQICYYIGRLVDEFSASLEQQRFDEPAYLRRMVSCRAFYLSEITAARKRVVTTILCLRRLGMYRDLTNMIAHLVWADRDQVEIPIEPIFKRLKK